MAADVIVRPLAEADVREAAFWYERKRRIRGSFPKSETGRDERCCVDFPTRCTL